MKRTLLIIALLVCSLGAKAQTGYAQVEKNYPLFEFELNANRLEFGFNFGEAGSFSNYARLAMGANLLVNGIYLDFLASEPEHKYSRPSDTKWNDHVAFCINAGYQIPILKWLRVMPLVGYAQTNDGITDASKTIWDIDEYSSSTYHPYKVTKGTREHYLNYGGGLSIQPSKWFSINLIATRHAIYGGVGVDLLAFARK